MSGVPRRSTVTRPAARYGLDRMTPYDPTGAGRTLDAPEVRIDGRAVAPDGTFGPLVPAIVRGPVTIAPGEAVVITSRGRPGRL